jgi:hypothetical protein
LNGKQAYSSFPLIKRILKEMGLFRTDRLVHPYLPVRYDDARISKIVDKIRNY